MAERRKYQDEDRARVYTALTINNGNIKRTARETGVPVATVRLWKRNWEKDGPSKEVALLSEEQGLAWIAFAEESRDVALTKWRALVEADKVAARDLMTGVGILTDKIHAARGLSKGSSSQPAISPEHMRELARGLVEGAVEAAKNRDQEILDAEYEVVHEIPSRTS